MKNKSNFEQANELIHGVQEKLKALGINSIILAKACNGQPDDDKMICTVGGSPNEFQRLIHGLITTDREEILEWLQPVLNWLAEESVLAIEESELDPTTSLAELVHMIKSKRSE